MAPSPPTARAFGRGVEHLVSWSVAHRRLVLTASLVAALVVGPGMARLEVHNRMTDWVDPEDPDAAAFLAGIEGLPPLVDFERSILTYRGDDPDGLLSHSSLREQERLVDRILADVPESTGAFGPVVFVQLAHYEAQRARGERPEAARLPAEELEMDAAIEAAKRAFGPALDYALSDDARMGFVAFPFAAPPFTKDATRVGAGLAAAVEDAYAEEAFATLDGANARVVGVASVTSHVDRLMARDMVVLGSIGLCLVFALFWLAAGRLSWVIGGFLGLLLGLVLLVGALGWLGVPFNVLNFAVLPLVMGNGIDYMIHVLAESRADPRSFGRGLGRHLGKALGVPIVLVTLTTVVGLGSLALSASPYLRGMGLLAGVAIALVALLSLTFLPAFLATFHRGEDGGPRKRRVRLPRVGAPFETVGRAGKRHPVLLVAVLGVPSAFGAWAFLTTEYRVDLFSGSLPEGDPVLETQDLFEERFGTETAWFLVLRGDVVSDASFAFQQRFVGLATDRGLMAADHAYDLARLAEGHHRQRSVPGGLGGVLPPLPALEATAEEKVAALEAEAPYAAVVRPLVSPDHRFGALYVLPAPMGDTAPATDEGRGAFQEAVADAAPPPGLDVHVYSFKLLARDFMAESQASLQVLYVVSLAGTLVLFLAVTHDVRATAIVALPVVVSSLWWFGLLRLFIGSIGVYQLIALVFITSLGSDYAAYLVYKHRDSGDWSTTLRVTGRAVLFSALTDAGAFLVFSLTSVRSGGEMLLGAALAVTSVFLATLAIVPALLPRTAR